jgi:hypothetical protein
MNKKRFSYYRGSTRVDDDWSNRQYLVFMARGQSTNLNYFPDPYYFGVEMQVNLASVTVYLSMTFPFLSEVMTQRKALIINLF